MPYLTMLVSNLRVKCYVPLNTIALIQFTLIITVYFIVNSVLTQKIFVLRSVKLYFKAQHVYNFVNLHDFTEVINIG